ncbi:hydrolase [Psychromonas marina]|uniref:Hydrolase n=1 Tax=Psychromonas marina TaxID=88364 RepID=A0ABQ6E3Z3_9GAMM|nr:HAD family hydrolase [Psychromonas marina]GLS92061.1 hydrolase [Psychromonas marina]
MNKIVLFDWGDTLMVDFTDQPGHMKDWANVQAVNGAEQALKRLSSISSLFVATGAIGTTSELMRLAFQRTSLSPFISGYYCPNNVGYEKPSAQFYKTIAHNIDCRVEDIIMVGDNLERDILPAIAVGMSAIWLNSKHQKNLHNVNEISCLNELCSLYEVLNQSR